jgi:hypothetical protein
MTALSNDLGILRNTTIPDGLDCLQPRASAVFRPGAIVAHRRGSNLAEVALAASPRTDLIVVGRFVGQTKFTASSTADSDGGAVDADGNPESVTIAAGIIGSLDNSAGANEIGAEHVDLPVFLVNDNTVSLTDQSGTLSFAGFFHGFDDAGKLCVRMNETDRAFAGIFSPSGGGDGLTSNGSARLVATNLAAGAFSGGVFTATANGALATQDGVAPDVGNILVLPPGTLTTLVVSAADSGPYEVTSLGAAGAKVVLTRPANYQHGDTIVSGTAIQVGGEGTTYKNTRWIAKPATAAKVVGTDDPLMFPEQMIVAKTLASGTGSITTIPLRAAGLFFVGVDFTGGTPAATTTSLQASTQTPGGLGTASIVIQEQSVLGTLVATGTATCNVIVRQ